MKTKLIAFVAVCLFAAQGMAWDLVPAPGPGEWTYIGHNIYRGSTYLWYGAYNCYGVPIYRQLTPISIAPSIHDSDFWTKMAELNVESDNEASRKEYVESRWPGQPGLANTNYATSGYSVTTQGYVPGGTTLFSTGVPVATVDINGIIHEAQRLQELAQNGSNQATAQVNTIVSQAVDGNTAAAKIKAAGEVAAAAIAASQQPVTTTTVFAKTPVAGPEQAAQTQSGDPIALLSKGLLAQYCAKCHNGQKTSGGLDVTGDLSSLASFKDAINKRLHIPGGQKGHMPADGKILALPVITGLLAGIPDASPQPTSAPQPVMPPDSSVPPAPPSPGD